MPSNWDKLDAILRRYSPRIRDDLRLTPPISNYLASAIASEVAALPSQVLKSIADADSVGLRHRLDELVAFEGFMDFANDIQQAGGPLPQVTRSQVICQLYVAFVYLGDSCFSRLQSEAPAGSVLKKCCKYLTDGKLRGLRNAVAHANWTYTDDFSGIRYHYFADKERTQRRDHVATQLELEFWDKLARVTAYAAFQTIHELTQ